MLCFCAVVATEESELDELGEEASLKRVTRSAKLKTVAVFTADSREASASVSKRILPLGVTTQKYHLILCCE